MTINLVRGKSGELGEAVTWTVFMLLDWRSVSGEVRDLEGAFV